jgi:hypothetical protein
MSASRDSSTEIQEIAPDARRHAAAQPPDETALLITCLRGLPFHVPGDTDWDALLRLAQGNGVLALLHRSLLEKNTEMPRAFTSAALKARNSAERLAVDLEGLLRRFREPGIEVLPLKGPAMAEALYGDAALRPSVDLDLMVRRRDFERAGAVLLDLGFAAGPSSDYDRRFLRDGLAVELHFELAAPQFCSFDIEGDIEGIWARSRAGNFRGQAIRVLSDIDLVLYLCCHGLKHGFSRLIWIMDIARAMRGWQPVNCQELLARARRQGFEPWLRIGCEMVRDVFPQQLPDALEEVLSAQPQAAMRARRAASRLIAEGAKTAIDDNRDFYLQAELSPLKRWRYRLRCFAPTQTDYRWADRHGLKRELMVFLRPFRLLGKYGLSRVWRILFPSAA